MRCNQHSVASFVLWFFTLGVACADKWHMDSASPHCSPGTNWLSASQIIEDVEKIYRGFTLGRLV
jgi:hypothetical protein